MAAQAKQTRLFGYDSEQNLCELATLAPDGVTRETQQAQYDVAGRVIRPGDGQYEYDACGRLVVKRRTPAGFRPQETRYEWDAHDRLVRIQLPDGARWRYRYDCFGRRVSKAREGSLSSLTALAKVEYLWDGDQLVGQQRYLADGSAARETQWVYEPGSFRPLAQVEGHSGNTQLHYIVTDLTGTARELCSEEGEVHWRGDQQLWGQHRETRTPMALRRFIGDAANDETGCDLRYQGQLYDAESGLYYNRHRYYDPEIGQYISSDPIGLRGGRRPQGYVHNPACYMDPLGLSGCPSSNDQGKISYRGDSRDPDVIFKDGFQTKGSSDDLLKHAADNNSPPSNFISTSKSPDVAAEFGSQFYTEEGYVYAIKSSNGIDVNAALGKAAPFPNEMEIAIPGGVKLGQIMGATPVNADGSLGNYSILNPKYYGY